MITSRKRGYFLFMDQEDKIFYQQLSGKELSEQDCFEARSNLVGFFNLLFEIDQRIKEKSNEQNNGNTNNPN